MQLGHIRCKAISTAVMAKLSADLKGAVPAPTGAPQIGTPVKPGDQPVKPVQQPAYDFTPHQGVMGLDLSPDRPEFKGWLGANQDALRGRWEDLAKQSTGLPAWSDRAGFALGLDDQYRTRLQQASSQADRMRAYADAEAAYGRLASQQDPAFQHVGQQGIQRLMGESGQYLGNLTPEQIQQMNVLRADSMLGTGADYARAFEAQTADPMAKAMAWAGKLTGAVKDPNPQVSLYDNLQANPSIAAKQFQDYSAKAQQGDPQAQQALRVMFNPDGTLKSKADVGAGIVAERNAAIMAKPVQMAKDLETQMASGQNPGLFDQLFSMAKENPMTLLAPVGALLMLFGGDTGKILGALALGVGGKDLYDRYARLESGQGKDLIGKVLQYRSPDGRPAPYSDESIAAVLQTVPEPDRPQAAQLLRDSRFLTSMAMKFDAGKQLVQDKLTNAATQMIQGDRSSVPVPPAQPAP